MPTALSLALRPLFSFQQVLYAQVFPLKLAPLCELFAGLCSTYKSATSHLLSDSRFVLATLFSFPPFLLPQSLWHELCSYCSCSIRLQWVPGHSFLPGNNAADKLAGQGALLVPSVIPCGHSLLLLLVFAFIFSQTGGVLSHLNSLTHRFPRFPPRNLCFLRHARCIPSGLRCKQHSLLLSSYQLMIGRIENRYCSACRHLSQDTSHLILHCPATDSLRRSLFGDSLTLYNLWSRPLGVSRLLELDGLPPCPHPSEGVK